MLYRILPSLSLSLVLAVPLVAQEVAVEVQRFAPSTTGFLPAGLNGPDLDLHGDYAVLGLPTNGVAGEALVFERSGGTWSEVPKLLPSTPALGAFGDSVAVDGNRIAVGHGIGDAVDLFERIAGTWTAVQRLDAPNPGGFGQAVALDGDTLVVGARLTPLGGTANVGAAYVYVHSAGTWTLEQFIQPALGVETDLAGTTVAVDGDTLVLGVPEPGGFGLSAGKGLVYVRSAGTWTQQAVLIPPTGYSLSGYGTFLAFEGDVAVLSNQLGDVYAFERSGTTWTASPRIYPAGVPFFGYLTSDLALSDGRLVLVDNASNFLAPAQGAAYLFTPNGGVWEDRQAFSPLDDPQEFGQFGHLVAVDGDQMMVLNSRGVNPQSTEAVIVYSLAPETYPTSCFGNGSSAEPGCATCPCGNDAPAFTRGGCINSTSRWAKLAASGTASVSADSLEFDLTFAAPNTFALLFAGQDLLPLGSPTCSPGTGVSGATALDGLRCVGAGPGILRLGVRPTSTDGDSVSPWGGGGGGAGGGAGGGLIALGGFAAGETQHFQVFYRDTNQAACGTGQGSSNAVTVLVTP